jgi:P27 family predicted phage terminase small subunit
MRGRKPLATAVKEASGAFIKDPQRKNKNEPKATRGWPEISSAIKKDKVAVERWNHVCKELDSQGILTTADFYLLEYHCSNYSLWISLKAVVDSIGVVDEGEKSRSAKPEAKMMLELERQMLKQIIEMGLTPSARSRLKVQEKQEENPFETWLNSDN